MNTRNLICHLLLLLGANYACAGDIIANAGVSLSANEAKDVFTGDKQTAGAVKLVLADNASELDAFASGFLKMDAHKYQSLWAKKSFREGLNPPATKTNDADVASFVKSTPGAIGYVKSAPPGVKVIGKY